MASDKEQSPAPAEAEASTSSAPATASNTPEPTSSDPVKARMDRWKALQNRAVRSLIRPDFGLKISCLASPLTRPRKNPPPRTSKKFMPNAAAKL